MLKTTTCLLMATILNLSFNTHEALAISRKQCQRAHERIAQRYLQSQPSLLDSYAYQRWANSLMNTIQEFEQDNPECPRATKTSSYSGGLTPSQQQQLDDYRHNNLLNQIEEDGKFRMRRYCQAYGRKYDASTNSCYD